MQQVLVATAVGLAAVAAFRLLRREMTRVSDRLSEVRVPTEIDAGPRLVRGVDGVYRPEIRRG